MNFVTCVYCGAAYPEGTPTHGAQVLTDHIAECEKHPMRAVVEEHRRLRESLVRLVGASEPDELEAMELFIRTAPMPDEDRVGPLNAIHALKAVKPR